MTEDQGQQLIDAQQIAAQYSADASVTLANMASVQAAHTWILAAVVFMLVCGFWVVIINMRARKDGTI